MKNYLVKALRSFDDYEGLDVKEGNPFTKRKQNDFFYCTKERYEYLKENNAVLLEGIDEMKINTTNKIELEEKPKSSKKRTSKK